MLEFIASLGDHAEGQNGYFTQIQAKSSGSSDLLYRLVNADAVERVGHGVYRMVGAPGLEPAIESIYAHYLPISHSVLGSGGSLSDLVICGESAATVHRIGDFLADSVQLYSSTPLRVRRHGVSVVTKEVERKMRTFESGMWVLNPAATVADLFSKGYELSHIGDAIADGLRVSNMNLNHLIEFLDVEDTQISQWGDAVERVHAILSASYLSARDRDYYISLINVERKNAA